MQIRPSRRLQFAAVIVASLVLLLAALLLFPGFAQRGVTPAQAPSFSLTRERSIQESTERMVAESRKLRSQPSLSDEERQRLIGEVTNRHTAELDAINQMWTSEVERSQRHNLSKSVLYVASVLLIVASVIFWVFKRSPIHPQVA